MSQLPYELEFMHKYNLHKLLGLLIEDDDIPAIARIYGVSLDELKDIDRRYRQNVSRMARELASKRPPEPAVAPLTILALGDSITSDRESYVKILAEYWTLAAPSQGRSTAADVSGQSLRRIIDCGISGDTCCDVVNRFYSTVLNEEFDWAIVFLGTNDCRQLDDPARISNLSLEEFGRDLRYFVERLLKRGKEVVHVTLPPVDNERLREFFPDDNWVYDPAHLEAANAIIRELARENGSPVADLAEVLVGRESEVLEPDGLHLNAGGHLALCRLLLDIVP
jgi:lysophospholipase L1-like esterase